MPELRVLLIAKVYEFAHLSAASYYSENTVSNNNYEGYPT